MNRSEFDVKKLVGMIETGELRLPELQRRYVWQSTRVRDLFDSLYRGYPSGTILMWETDREQPTRNLAVRQEVSPFSGNKLLLDGQQRLTSLSAVLRGEPVKVKNKKKPIELLFNLEHPDELEEFSEVEGDEDSSEDQDTEAEDTEEEAEVSVAERLRKLTFVIEAKALAQKPNWVSVSKVFRSDSNNEIMKKAGVTSMDDPRFDKYSRRLQKLRSIREYMYNVQILPKDLNYEEVAEIFVRVNSLGAKLRGSDLALAQITARWPNSLKLLEEFQEECEEHWMTLDLGLLVRAMVVFATGQSRFRTVANVPIDKFKFGWEQAKEGLRFAINFLKANAGIEDESLLSSPFFFVAIAYFIQARKGHLRGDEEKALLHWLYVANARGRYSRGSSESLLDADLVVIAKGGTAQELLETVRQQFGRTHIEVGDFVGRGPRSPLFSLVFLALKARGAKDWWTGLELSLTHQGKYHYIEFHHIFPKSLLKGSYEQGVINEIANMAFISSKVNKKISNREPYEYFPNIVTDRGEKALTAQGIPLSPELHKLENYSKFLAERRKLLTVVVNEFLEKTRTGS